MFWRPHGITIDAAGNLYVAETNNSRIRKVTPKGEVSTLAGSEMGFADGSGSDARFYIPEGIAIDATGNLYVADTYNNRIRKVTPKGKVSTLAGSGEEGFADGQGNTAQFNRPSGIAIDAAGNLYVADFWNSRIRKITVKGEVSTLAGSDEEGLADGQGSSARFDGPSGITIDAAGNLYVTDVRNNRIRMVTSEGEVSTLAGSDSIDPDEDEVGGFADGEGSVAKFDGPSGIAIDAAGNLYVSDSNNYRIRKIEIRRP
jgi:sugar lactone lactonase YvrE